MYLFLVGWAGKLLLFSPAIPIRDRVQVNWTHHAQAVVATAQRWKSCKKEQKGFRYRVEARLEWGGRTKEGVSRTGTREKTIKNTVCNKERL